MVSVVVEQYSEATHHELFFDNFFTSHDIMQKLTSQSMRTTDTVRENRINSATKTMTSHKDLKKNLGEVALTTEVMEQYM